ncbi:Peroxidase [Heracleum sosnowskyi]|uniref:Peroxidase n=1 Tax=Heracleum sosnowskyi TaxID=360622 RepID=A0AAD8J1P2_9APIA|nr:Peroxidase [Heracleum sosnowskyi]
MTNSGPTIIIYMIFFTMCMTKLQTTTAAELKQHFYGKSCPAAERMVRRTVSKAIAKNPEIAAGLIRLYFHDCFVRGCDASILLKSTPENETEQDSGANGATLRGMEVIHEAKAKLEAECPKTVSCADIVAFAARDSTFRVGGFFYRLPSGRRDGRVSLVGEPGENLPLGPGILSIFQFFSRKGMSVKEMTALLGAHSIGIVECRFFSNRLYTFNNKPNTTDPSLDKKFASFLKRKCPENSPSGGKVNLDVVTPNRLDSQFYKNLKNKMGVLEIDQQLESSPLTANIVSNYSRFPEVWAADFAAAMIHLGSIDVLTGNQGEIRKDCEVIN